MAKVARSTCGPSKVEKAQEAKPAVSASSAEKAPMVREDANLSSTGLQRESEQQDPCGSAKQTGDRVSTSDPRERGMPDLSDAAMKDLIDTVETLTRSPCLESPEALNWRDPKHGMTALGFAALWGFRNVVGLLLRHCCEHGVEVAPLLERHSLFTDFHTPLFTAAIDGHHDVLTQLVPYIPVDHPVVTEYWQVTPGQSLSDARVSSEGDGAEAVTLGMCVAAMGHPDVLRPLLAAGAPMTAAPTNCWLTDALTLAIDYPDLTPPIPLGVATTECRPPLPPVGVGLHPPVDAVQRPPVDVVQHPPVGVVPRPPCQGASGEAPLKRTPSASGDAPTHQELLPKTESVSNDNACSVGPKDGMPSKTESVPNDKACSAEPRGGVLSKTESVSDDNARLTHQELLSKTEPSCDDDAYSAEPKGGTSGEAGQCGMLPPNAGEWPRVEPDAGELSPDAGERSRVEPDAGELSPDAGERVRVEPDAGELSPDAGKRSRVETDAGELSPDAGELSPDAGERSHVEPDAGERSQVESDAGKLPPDAGEQARVEPDAGELSPDAVDRSHVEPDAGELSPDAVELSRVVPDDQPSTPSIVEVTNTVNSSLDDLDHLLSALERFHRQLFDLLKVELTSLTSGPAVDGTQCQATPNEAEVAEALGIKREMVALWRHLRFELADWRAAQVRVAELTTVAPDYTTSHREFTARVKSGVSAGMAMFQTVCDRAKELAEVRKREKVELNQRLRVLQRRRPRRGGGASNVLHTMRQGSRASDSHTGGGRKGSVDATSAADAAGPPAPQPTAPSPLAGRQRSTQCVEATVDALKLAEQARPCPLAACQSHESDAGTTQPDSPQPDKKDLDGDDRRTPDPEGCTGSEAQQGFVSSKGGAGEGSLRGGGELRRGHLDCILLLLRTRMYGITPRQRQRVLVALDAAGDNVMVVRRLRRFMDSCLRECKFCGQWGHWHLCRRCLCTPYCSKAHHRADWRQHRQTCSPATPPPSHPRDIEPSHQPHLAGQL